VIAPNRGEPARFPGEEVHKVQGVIKSYDPGSGDGIVVRDTDLGEVDLAPDALSGSVFRLLRQGQRVIFDLNAEGQATHLRLGSEVDMGTPGLDPERGAPPA
jgi:CspA family cold shock protein